MSSSRSSTACNDADICVSAATMCCCLFIVLTFFLILTLLQASSNHENKTECYVDGVVVPLVRTVCGSAHQGSKEDPPTYCWSDQLVVHYNAINSSGVWIHAKSNVSAGAQLLLRDYPSPQDALCYLQKHFASQHLTCWYDDENPSHITLHHPRTNRDDLIINDILMGLCLLSLVAMALCRYRAFRRLSARNDAADSFL